MQAIIDKLRGGDRRSIGRATEVVREIEDNPALFKAVFTGLFDDEPVVRMRSADVIEKVTQGGPELLKGYTSKVISILATAEQQEICWHMAQIAPRLQCNTAQEDEIVELLKKQLSHKSKIVQASALEALATIAGRSPERIGEIFALVTVHQETGSPAVQARARKVLKRLERVKQNSSL